MTFIVAKKQGPHGLLLIISDKGDVGKLFQEGRKQLDLRKEFYQGDEKTAKEVELLLGTVQHLHFTGKQAVALGITAGFIDQRCILYVQQVPHAEVVMSL